MLTEAFTESHQSYLHKFSREVGGKHGRIMGLVISIVVALVLDCVILFTFLICV